MALNGLKLNSVLHVPNLQCNLLSMSKLTMDLNYSVTFFPSCCKFQDLSSDKAIGNVEEQNGLYYFSGAGSSSRPKLLTIFPCSLIQMFYCGIID